MAYTLEQKERPYGSGTRHEVLRKLLTQMQITEVGELGDCLVLPGKLRKISDSAAYKRKTRSVIAKEDAVIRSIAKENGMKFKCHSDRDAMTVTYWRVK